MRCVSISMFLWMECDKKPKSNTWHRFFRKRLSGLLCGTGEFLLTILLIWFACYTQYFWWSNMCYIYLLQICTMVRISCSSSCKIFSLFWDKVLKGESNLPYSIGIWLNTWWAKKKRKEYNVSVWAKVFR